MVNFVQQFYALPFPLSLILIGAAEVQAHAAADPSEGAA